MKMPIIRLVETLDVKLCNNGLIPHTNCITMA